MPTPTYHRRDWQMVFSSAFFLFAFLPASLVGYYLIPTKFKNGWLLFASLVFYSWAGFEFTVLFIALTLVNYFIGLGFGLSSLTPQQRKALLVFAVFLNVMVLAFFKYFNFFETNVQSLLNWINPGIQLGAPKIPLPVGISFFIFQKLSYLLDLYWGKVKPQKNILNLALYAFLFPQLIAGPIVRYVDIEREIDGPRKINRELFKSGLVLFMIGFAKKVLLANNVGIVADTVFKQPDTFPLFGAWVGVIAYALQIFFDFSGYSDMAIGIGRMFGFHFKINFNQPYTAISVRDFWQRWHISLSSWFKDYLYIPLGGNRKGSFKTYRNLLIVFFITGLWHGASWTFVIWGLYFGIFLILERGVFGRLLEASSRWVQTSYTLLVVLFGWVIFRAENMNDVVTLVTSMFSWKSTSLAAAVQLLSNERWVFLLVAVLAVIPWNRSIRLVELAAKANDASSGLLEIARDIVLFLAFLVSIAYVMGNGFNPFIYFRF
jgi:alginate O-acetyltransferase complex protein AlgI